MDQAGDEELSPTRHLLLETYFKRSVSIKNVVVSRGDLLLSSSV